jgi:hypothetical protein
MTLIAWLLRLELKMPAIPLSVVAVITGLLATQLEIREPTRTTEPAREVRITLEGQASAVRALGDVVVKHLRATDAVRGADLHGEGETVVVTAHPANADARSFERIKAVVANEQFPTWPSVRVSYLGAIEERPPSRRMLAPDAVIAAGLALAAALLVASLYFRRARAVGAVGVVGTVAMVWTLGVVQLATGRLTTGSAVVTSLALAPSTVFLARYFHERAHSQSIVRAVRRARFAISHSVVLVVLAGALLAGRMFSHEDDGVVLAIAIVAGWTLAMLMLPALVALFQAIAPEKVMRPSSGLRP